MTKVQLNQVSEDVRKLNPELFEETAKPTEETLLEGIIPVYKEHRSQDKEDKEQAALVSWLQWLSEDADYMAHGYFFHTPNGGKRDGLVGARMKAIGTKPGVPDLLNPILKWAIELKVRYRKPTPEQIEWLLLLRQNGWHVAVAYSAQDAKVFLSETFGISSDLL